MVRRSILLSITLVLLVDGNSQCTADFSHTANWDTVSFMNLSSASSAYFYWNFGDGSTSHAVNVSVHSSATNGFIVDLDIV